MIILKRITPYWTALLAALLLLGGVFYPERWWFWLAILLCLPLVAVWIMRQPQWRYELIGLSVPMTLLLGGGFGFLLIQDKNYWQAITVIVTALLFWLFEKNIAVFVFQPSKYIPFSLEHISTYCTIVASFYAYASLFIFSILKLTRLRYIFIAAAILTALMVWQTFWIQKIAWEKARWFVLVISLVITEVVVCLYYWPVSFFVSGITLTLLLYVLLHLSRHHLTASLTKQLLWRYLLTGLVGLLVLLLTAQWYYL